MRALAEGLGGDIPVVCGESSAATMGVMLKAGNDISLREKLGLDSNSQVLLFGLEGAIDIKIFEEIVGMRPQAVFDAQKRFS